MRHSHRELPELNSPIHCRNSECSPVPVLLSLGTGLLTALGGRQRVTPPASGEGLSSPTLSTPSFPKEKPAHVVAEARWHTGTPPPISPAAPTSIRSLPQWLQGIVYYGPWWDQDTRSFLSESSYKKPDLY